MRVWRLELQCDGWSCCGSPLASSTHVARSITAAFLGPASRKSSGLLSGVSALTVATAAGFCAKGDCAAGIVCGVEDLGLRSSCWPGTSAWLSSCGWPEMLGGTAGLRQVAACNGTLGVLVAGGGDATAAAAALLAAAPLRGDTAPHATAEAAARSALSMRVGVVNCTERSASRKVDLIQGSS